MIDEGEGRALRARKIFVVRILIFPQILLKTKATDQHQ